MSKWLIFMWILVLSLAMTPRAASADDDLAGRPADQELLLDVQINGQPIGKVGEFKLRNGKLMATPAELHDLGIRVPEFLRGNPGERFFCLNVAGLQWTLDEQNQIVKITANTGSLLPQVLQPGRWQTGEGRRKIESGTGLTLNYDVVSTFASGQAGATGSFDMRAFRRTVFSVPDGSGMPAHPRVGPASPGVCASIRRIPLPM